MPRNYLNSGQEVISADGNAVVSRHEIEIYDRVIYELMRRQQNVVLGDSFIVSYINATTVQVKAGNGMQLDNTQVDPEPQTRLLRVATNTNKTLAAADGTNNRIDIVCIQAARGTAATDTRNVKDINTAIVSATSVVVETDWASTLTVVTGTPSGSPVAPATPTGCIKLAEVLVVAVTGLAGPSGITDKRPLFNGTGNIRTAINTTYQILPADEMLDIDASGGAFTATLPPAALMSGRIIEGVLSGNAGANTFTLAGSGSDNISGTSTQAFNNQYTSFRVWSNGTAWFIL